ncbi:MAG: ABC transporter ATP-binding protein [Negativicutes bacterium]|nr:ABC transporter ATP-binding protein [Negativicutes bacterium]
MNLIRHAKILAPFFRRRWPLYVAGIVVLIIVDLLQLIIPRLIGTAIDKLTASDYSLGGILLAITAVAVITALLRYLYREFIMGTTRHLEFFLREKLFSHALRLPLSYFDNNGPGRVMALTINDITAVRVAVGLGIMLSVDAVIMGLASFLIMARVIDWQLTWQAVCPLPFILLAATRMGKSVHASFKNVQNKFSQLTEFTQETFGGMRVIKGFAAENVAVGRFTVVSRENVAANIRMARLQAAYVPLTHTSPMLCYAIALYSGGSLIIAGRLTVGDLAAFLGYLGLIIWPVLGLGYLINIVQRGSASLARLDALLAESPYEDELPAAADRLGAVAIAVRDLTFSYPAAAVPALKNLNLAIPAGAVVGIVGRTGAGKSTLLKLLLRLYDPPLDTVYVGDREIHAIDYLTLRQSIGYVPQDGLLFSRPISENIAFDRDRSREEIVEAASLAAVREDIDSKPFGFSTVLGEKGRRLSGGQQQRVAVARALVKQPGILLLDDVFAPLDYQTQTELLANIKTFSGGRTTLIVSQRVAAVKDADFIVVLEGGTIAEQGTHVALVAANGLYHKLYEQQLLAGEV